MTIQLVAAVLMPLAATAAIAEPLADPPKQYSIVEVVNATKACLEPHGSCVYLRKGERVVVTGWQIDDNPRRGLYCLRPLNRQQCYYADLSAIEVNGVPVAAIGMDKPIVPASERAAAVGDIVDFKSSIVGCSKWEDAYQAMLIRTAHGLLAEADFGRETDGWKDGHFCIVFGDNRRSGWRIVRMHRTKNTSPNDMWICIEPEQDEAKSKDPNRLCYWMFIADLRERK